MVMTRKKLLQVIDREKIKDAIQRAELRTSGEICVSVSLFFWGTIENAEDKRDLEELCRQVRQAMGSGDRKKMEEASAQLNDKLLNYAYLL